MKLHRVGLAAMGWVLGAGLAAAQTAPAPCPAAGDAQGSPAANTNCSPAVPSAPAAQRFPYPGDQTPTSPAAPGATAPSAPQPSGQGSASKRFPYPGEAPADGASAPAQPPAAPQTPLQDAGSSGQSSSSSSSNSSSSSSSSNPDATGGGDSSSGGAGDASNAKDPDADDPAAIPRSKRHKLPPVPRQTPSEREQEDVQVAGFYFNDGNFTGSYDRAKDAVSLDGDDAAAQLALGNAARKLGRLDEAERAYRRCLELDPVPKVRKPAEKALHDMTGA